MSHYLAHKHNAAIICKSDILYIVRVRMWSDIVPISVHSSRGPPPLHGEEWNWNYWNEKDNVLGRVHSVQVLAR